MGRYSTIVISIAYAKYLIPRPFFQYTFHGNCINLAPIEYGYFSGRPGPVSGIRSIINKLLKPVQKSRNSCIKFIMQNYQNSTEPKQKSCSNSKVVPYSIRSVGHGADPGFLAVSPQVT